MRETNAFEKNQKKETERLYLHPTSQERHFVPLPLEALSSAENPSRNLHQRLATNLKEKEGQQVRVIYILLACFRLVLDI